MGGPGRLGASNVAVEDEVSDETVRLLEEFIGMAEAVARLPSEVLQELSEGPWPEPFCGVCRALEKVVVSEVVDFTLYRDVMLIVDWHDEPLRRRRGRYDSSLGEETYYRCLAVYAAAKVAIGK